MINASNKRLPGDDVLGEQERIVARETMRPGSKHRQ